VLIYTSGTTGQPKGALIPHRALIGNLSGFVCSQNWFGFDPAHRAASRVRGGVLVAGGLGLDRRPDGCAVAQPVFRPADRGLERPLHAGVRLRR
jgi:acyl-CoA synthetase (AMP-forming)/AMP-acid ligase II